MAEGTADPNEGLPASLHITVRFTSSDPDLLLEINRPNQTTVIALKHLIRSKLSTPTSSHRFRLIYSGKLLPETAYLTSVLKIPAPPPRATIDAKGKGKAVKDECVQQLKVYINCSIGDELSEEELLAEAAAATSYAAGSIDEPADGGPGSVVRATTTPSPRGFDRLLSAGFTAAEVGQLRLQFTSIQSSAYTQDTMPSPGTMRRLEDAWIDNNGANGTGGSEAEADMAAGALDDLLMGLVIGFLWPLGAMGWLVREEGVWSARRQTAIWSGFMVCLTFGIMNVLS